MANTLTYFSSHQWRRKKSFILNNRCQCGKTFFFFSDDKLRRLFPTRYVILASYLRVRPFACYMPQLIGSGLTRKYSISMKKCTSAKHSSLFCLKSVMKIKSLKFFRNSGSCRHRVGQIFGRGRKNPGTNPIKPFFHNLWFFMIS